MTYCLICLFATKLHIISCQHGETELRVLPKTKLIIRNVRLAELVPFITYIWRRRCWQIKFKYIWCSIQQIKVLKKLVINIETFVRLSSKNWCGAPRAACANCGAKIQPAAFKRSDRYANCSFCKGSCYTQQVVSLFKKGSLHEHPGIVIILAWSWRQYLHQLRIRRNLKDKTIFCFLKMQAFPGLTDD